VSAARTEAADYLVAGEEKPWMHVSVALLSFSFLVFYWLQGPPRVPRAYIMDALLVTERWSSYDFLAPSTLSFSFLFNYICLALDQ
jgi:hypothetical protein